MGGPKLVLAQFAWLCAFSGFWGSWEGFSWDWLGWLFSWIDRIGDGRKVGLVDCWVGIGGLQAAMGKGVALSGE